MAANKSNERRERGARSGVLLIHGLCGSPAEMRFLANCLSRDGHKVVCPELAGHGADSAQLRQTNWQDWLESARKALFELAQDCDHVTVGGLSTGALVALMLAADHPELVQNVALYSPTIWLNGRKVPWSLRLARHLLAFECIARRLTFPAPQNYGVKDARIREFLQSRTDGGAAQHTTPAIAALERRRLAAKVLLRLGSITQPVLIMHPREDCLADLNNAFHLQRHLAGPVELQVLDDSYHLVTIDRQRQLVADATIRFLARGAAAWLKRPAATRLGATVPALRSAEALA